MCGWHAEVNHSHSAARVVPDGEGQVVVAVGTAGDRLGLLHTLEEILSARREGLHCITPGINYHQHLILKFTSKDT